MHRVLILLGIITISSAFPATTFAHSVVLPVSTATSKYETFSLGVPTEKSVATISMRLVIPEGLDHVMPIVKPGWRVTVSKDAEGKVTLLTWTGGSIPPEQKDVFQFSARTPAEPTTLVWRVYQTYQGGDIVAWDQDPHAGKDEHDMSGVVPAVANPYSTTDVAVGTLASKSALPMLSSALALAALTLSALALVLTLRNKKASVV